MRPVTSMQQTGNLYADLSAYYDQFCAGIDYAQQCDFTRRAFDCFASSGGRDYLDLACGTGAHIDAMQGYGFHATGLDINVAMLAQARQRCPDAAFVLQQTGFDVTLLEHDYSRLRAWDGRSFNVLVVAVKPNLG